MHLIGRVVACGRRRSCPTAQYSVIDRRSSPPLALSLRGLDHFNRTICQPNSKLVGLVRMSCDNERVHSLASTNSRLDDKSERQRNKYSILRIASS